MVIISQCIYIMLCAFGLYSVVHQLFLNKTGGKKRPEIGAVEMYNPNKLLPSLPPLKYFSEFVGFFSSIAEINTNSYVSLLLFYLMPKTTRLYCEDLSEESPKRQCSIAVKDSGIRWAHWNPGLTTLQLYDLGLQGPLL